MGYGSIRLARGPKVSHFRRRFWLRRRSARYQYRTTCVRNDSNADTLPGMARYRKYPSTTRLSHSACLGIGRWRPRTSTSRITCSRARIRFYDVFRFTRNDRDRIFFLYPSGSVADDRAAVFTLSALENTRRLVKKHPNGKLFLNSRGRPWRKHARRVRSRGFKLRSVAENSCAGIFMSPAEILSP